MSSLRSPDRVKAVRQLLASYGDWEPSIRNATPSGAQPGEIGVNVEACPHCDRGKLKGGGSCRHCHGSGRRHTDPQTGREAPSAPDPDDFTVDPAELARSVRYRRVRCDRCGGKPGDRGCPGCAGAGTIETLDDRPTSRSLARLERDWPGLRASDRDTSTDDVRSDDMLAALDRKAAQWARGSYPELEHLLWRLRAQSPTAYRLVDVHLIHPVGIEVTPAIALNLEAAVAWLAERMPHRIRVPDQALRSWTDPAVRHDLWRSRDSDAARAERDQAIASRVTTEGAPTEQVAVEFGLSERRVRQIVAGFAVATVAA